jgi:hypothetical protein
MFTMPIKTGLSLKTNAVNRDAYKSVLFFYLDLSRVNKIISNVRLTWGIFHKNWLSRFENKNDFFCFVMCRSKIYFTDFEKKVIMK